MAPYERVAILDAGTQYAKVKNDRRASRCNLALHQHHEPDLRITNPT